MKNLIFAVFMWTPLGLHAAEFSKVQADKSSVIFVSKQMSVPVEGLFKKFTAQMRINPAKPEAGKAQIEIDLASIDVGSAEANDEVKGKSWFNVSDFPKAEFVSTSVKALGGGKFEATGKMTIKGKSMEVRAPFTLKEDTLATFRNAEFGFFGVVVYTRTQTPRRCGAPFNAADFVLALA